MGLIQVIRMPAKEIKIVFFHLRVILRNAIRHLFFPAVKIQQMCIRDRLKAMIKENFEEQRKLIGKLETALEAVTSFNGKQMLDSHVGAPRGRKNCCDLGYCTREKLGIPRGERYELCRSVHAEANAIISASRADMIGSTLYLVGRDYATKELVKEANPCAMCKRMIINAGISTVVVRDTPEDFRVTYVYDEWVMNDESLEGKRGY